MKTREMSWIRIERYLDKNKKTGKIQALLSPQMCQQCGNAGCEAVCPVYATYHNPDGLNAQILCWHKILCEQLRL